MLPEEPHVTASNTAVLSDRCARVFIGGGLPGKSWFGWFEGARLIVLDTSAPIENSAFLVEGDTFTWVGKHGERQPPQGAVRVDLSGKTVMPALIPVRGFVAVTMRSRRQ
jgi:hypothetical protein